MRIKMTKTACIGGASYMKGKEYTEKQVPADLLKQLVKDDCAVEVQGGAPAVEKAVAAPKAQDKKEVKAKAAKKAKKKKG